MKPQQQETFVQRILTLLKIRRKPCLMERSHERIAKSIVSWNDWREGTPTILPDLENVDLGEKDIYGANFRNVNLYRANLANVKKLKGCNLGGANLSGAELPEGADKFEVLSQVETSIRYNGKTFIALILGCVYTWLTIATTSDANLLTNSYFSPLPIIGTKIQIAGFYFVAPILLLFTYGYLHIQLQRLWERSSDLPAIFPDGQSIDKKISPWFPTSLLYHFIFHLSQKPPPLSTVQAFVSFVLVWLLLPIFTLPFIWLKYLPLQSWSMTGVHIAIIVVAIGFGIHSYLLAQKTLGRNSLNIIPPSYRLSMCISGVVGIILFLLSFSSFHAVHQHFIMMLETQPNKPLSSDNLPNQFPKPKWYQTVVHKPLAWVTYSPFPNLEGAEVSVRPSNWDGKTIEIVTGAKLRKSVLRYANLSDAFLVNADLQKADLQRANLSDVDLRGSQLGGANITGGYLMTGKLQRADLTSANLKGSYLLETKLMEANLRSVNGEMAWLNGANLEGANLKDAKFQCADFGRANLSWLENFHSAWGIDKERIMSVAGLEGAQFKDADLTGVRLEGANLSGVTGLTQEQLDKSCISERTALPDGLVRPKPCTETLINVIPETQKVTLYSTWGIGSLQQAALTVAHSLNDFSGATDKQLRHFSDMRTKNEDEQRKVSEQSEKFIEGQLAAYDKQFKGIAIQLRKEMLSRLNMNEQEVPILFNSPTNPYGMRQVANTIETLADQLCSVQQKRSRIVGTIPMLTS